MTVDTGGTKTLIVGFSEDGSVVGEVKYPTPRDREEYVEVLARTVREKFAMEEIEMIVIATPGMIEDGVIVKYDKLEWDGFRLVEQVEAEFPGVRVYLENDTNLGGMGVAKEVEARRVMYLTLSTGIGMGMMEDGKLVDGLRRAEIGKITVKRDGGAVIWELVASGKAFYEKHGKFGCDIDDEAVWREYAEDVGEGLAMTLAVLQPEVIVIGGSMGRYVDKFGRFLKEVVQRDVWPWFSDVEIVAARNPDWAVIEGCYEYAKLRRAD